MYRNTDEIASELIKQFAGLKKQQAVDIVKATLDCIIKGTASLNPGSSERVILPGFGSFALKKRSARKGRNPKTGEEIMVPESLYVAFKPGKAFNEVAKASDAE